MHTHAQAQLSNGINGLWCLDKLQSVNKLSQLVGEEPMP